MHEIEVKILEVDPSEIKKRLLKLGARKVFENAQIHAQLYDFPDRRIKKAGNLLRLRKIAGKIELTFKKKVSKRLAKDFEETDIDVNDFDAMHRMLSFMGLKCFSDHRKTRSRYRLGAFQYEIDKYQGIPYFVEIEIKSNNKKSALSQLKKAVAAIGYSMKDAKPWTGSDVHKHYHKKL